jgi:hypothetical protein
MPSEQHLSHIMARPSYIRWDDVRFVIDQQAKFNFFSDSSLKQSAGRYVAPLKHIILIPSQSVFALSPQCAKQRSSKYKFIVFGLNQQGLELKA